MHSLKYARRIVYSLTATAMLLTLTGCGGGGSGPDEEGYLEATTYLDFGDSHYDDQFDDYDQNVLAWGYEVCDALHNKKAEDAYAVKKAHSGYSDATLTWRTAQAIEYLCPEHEGEMIDWYNFERIDAAGRVSAGTSLPDLETAEWTRYAPDHIDHGERVVTTPMLLGSEIMWFKRHHTMPRTHPGAELTIHEPAPKVFENMARLTSVRVLGGRGGPTMCRPSRAEPLYALMDVSECVTDTERHYSVLNEGAPILRLVSTIPAAGKPVGLKGITVVARWMRTAPDDDNDGVPNGQDSTPSGNSYSYSSGGGGDDDFNIPGWLCPTRFC